VPATADLSKFPLGRRFAILTRMYYGALTKKLERLDIDRHFSILILLHTAGKECTQQYISDVMKKDKASMVRIVDYLTDKGYIRRVSNPDDRREHHIKLTEKAKKIMPAIHKAIHELNKAATRGLTEQQAKMFDGFLYAIGVNLSDQPSYNVIVNFKKAKQNSK
jgi:MarR family transcriptional regulator, transcriptional regulator for hemolysin